MKLTTLKKELENSNLIFFQKLFPLYQNSETELTHFLSRLKKLVSKFEQSFQEQEINIIRAPGRVNLIGEHTDYNGYPVMPMAVTRDILVLAAVNDSKAVSVQNTNERFEQRTFSIMEKITPYNAGDWGNYVKAAIVDLLPYIQENKGEVNGFNAVYDGNVPAASGLSSSSAMVVATAMTFLTVNNTEMAKDQLAERLARAERFVGTEGGGMDQAVSLMGKENAALKIDFFPLRTRTIPLPENYKIIISNSLMQAPKTEKAKNNYNRRPVECRIAAALLSSAFKSHGYEIENVARLCDVDIKKFDIDTEQYNQIVQQTFDKDIFSVDDIKQQLNLSDSEFQEKFLRLKSNDLFQPPEEGFKIKMRYDHVITESARVEQAAEMLQSGRIREFGKLMVESHQSCRDNYEISIEEMDVLVETALKHGAIGSRLTGAGFGGCTVSIVEGQNEKSFIDGMIRDYYIEYLGKKHPEIKISQNDFKEIIFSSTAMPGAEKLL